MTKICKCYTCIDLDLDPTMPNNEVMLDIFIYYKMILISSPCQGLVIRPGNLYCGKWRIF